MLLLRKIVFYIFALIYLVLCPLIVARLLGFVYDPLTHRLEKTGLIWVSTNPPDAAVYIDGTLAHQRTPTAVRDLTPGKHFIRIELNGYNDWEKNIPIIGKKATVLANILLIPEVWPIKRISTEPYQNIIPASDDMLVIVKDKNKHLWINLKNDPPLISTTPPLGLQTLPRVPKDFLINDKKDLLARQGDWIRLYSRGDFSSSQVYDIARSKPGTNMYFEENNGELFYLDGGGFLFAAQILPNHPILNIPIPDALRNTISKKEDES